MKVLDIKDLVLLPKKKKNQLFVPSLCSKSQGNTEIRYRRLLKLYILFTDLCDAQENENIL